MTSLGLVNSIYFSAYENINCLIVAEAVVSARISSVVFCTLFCLYKTPRCMFSDENN